MRRYLSQHWDGCMCGDCDPVYGAHNPDRNGPICACSGCRTRKAALDSGNALAPQTQRVYNNQGRVKTVATVNFCERCNTMGKSSAMGRLYFVQGPTTDSAVELEICPGCVADAIAFLKWEDNQAERPRSYTKPYSAPDTDPLASLSDEELAKAYLSRVAEREVAHELTTGSDDGTV